jgi:hypothetical protein
MNGKLIHTITVERSQGGWGAMAFPINRSLEGAGSWHRDRLTAVGNLVEYILRNPDDFTLASVVYIR